MLDNIALNRIYFLDIETVPQQPGYSELPEHFRELWDKKASYIKSEESDTPESIYQRAGIFAEFGKVVCISVGIFTQEGGEDYFRIKSFAGDDEKKMLEDFASLLNNYFDLKTHFLCAHNGKEFDFPYLSRRFITNGLEIPAALDNWGKKPWETAHLLDTMQLWRFGDFKGYTSLRLLCAVFDLPTPKDDISGEDVWKVYWEEKNLERIVIYCEKDVLAIARLMQKFMRFPVVDDKHVKSIK